MSRFIMPLASAFGQNVRAYDGAQLAFFEVGTETNKVIYADAARTIPMNNPVIANDIGIFSEIFLDGDYKVKLTNKNDVTQFEIDGYSAADPEIGVDNIAALKTVNPIVGGQVYELLGHTVRGIGGGRWYYDENDTTTPESDVVVVTDSNKRLKLIIEGRTVSSAQFGALGSLSDNQPFINSALEFAAANGCSVNDTGTSYEINLPVRVPSNCNYRFGSLVNTNSNSGNPNQMLCLYLGNYHPAYFSGAGTTGSYDRYAIEPYTMGLIEVEMSSPGDASNFSAGDVVFIRSQEHYLNGSIEQPITASLSRVVSVSGATVTIEEPLSDSFTDGWISQANNNALGILGDTLYACSDSIVQGDSLESVNGNCFERGGMYKSSLTVDKIESLTGVFTNLICFSEIRFNNVNVTRKMFDLAGNSNNSTVYVNSMTYSSSVASNNINQIALNENCVSNRIEINNVNAGDFSEDNHLIFIASARKNELIINSINAASHTAPNASCMQFVSGVTDPQSGESEKRCEYNKVVVTSVVGGDQRNLVSFNNDGDGLQGNNVDVGVALGTYVRAVALAGEGNNVIVNSASGNVSTNSASNNKVSGYVGGWINNWGEVLDNDFSDLTSDATRDAKSRSVSRLPVSVVNDTSPGTPLSTGPLNDGTLSYDINHASNIRIKYEGDIQGNGTKNLAITDDEGDLLNASFATTDTGQLSIDCSIFVTNTNRYDAISKVTFDGNTTLYRTTRNGLANFERTFSLNAIVGNGGEVVYRNATIEINP